LALIATPALAQARNPQIDYATFGRLVAELGPLREQRRLAWPEFARAAATGKAILLDARSADAFARGHLKGAINLPFTDFTAESLHEVLGDDPQRPIYIYCNNNFSDHRAPVALKAAPLALNIPTFINLHGYGYRNVWELADVIGSADSDVSWETSPGT
jgi:rhodanese-related sulfurtransferase